MFWKANRLLNSLVMIICTCMSIFSVNGCASLNERMTQAIMEGDEAKVRSLAMNGADLYDALSRAIDADNIRIVKTLIENGADPNKRLHFRNLASWVKEYYGSKSTITITPLEQAIGFSNIELTQVLLKFGARVEMAGKKGAFFAAIEAKATPEIVALIIDNGASMNEEFDGLIQSGGPVNSTTLTQSGYKMSSSTYYIKVSGTPLFWASHYNLDSIVQLLLSKGVDLNFKDQGKKALIEAQRNGSISIVEMLTHAGVRE